MGIDSKVLESLKVKVDSFTSYLVYTTEGASASLSGLLVFSDFSGFTSLTYLASVCVYLLLMTIGLVS